MGITKNIQFVLLFFICLLQLSEAGAKEQEKNSHFENGELLGKVFDKLHDLEAGRRKKINIVHIGDSHIQADFFTDVIRQALQSRFGDGGYGFTFPYSLAKTNGTKQVKYQSNIQWQNYLNVKPISGITIGLSGIGLYTDTRNFYIELNTGQAHPFNTVKVLYPTKEPGFELSLALKNETVLFQPEKQPVTAKANAGYHKVKAGETLYRIATAHNISVDALKAANNLRSNTIRAGQNIKIPGKAAAKYPKQTPVSENHIIKDDSLVIDNKPFVSIFSSPDPLNKIYLLPGNQSPVYNLSGIVLENDQPGVIYHAIGVNGSKTSDYNKYPIFFEQLSILNPDLVIISLGTNESFGKWVSIDYIYQMALMIKNIREKNNHVAILIMTPPPSLFRRNKLNTFVEEYSKALLDMDGCIIWDLLARMGGIYAPKDKSYAPLMAKDKVHYTKEGYKLQGELFSSDFLSAYDKYIKTK
ncbi:LysM peptidoglycan-binding domain-containing protein [Viscerimonas tarda]